MNNNIKKLALAAIVMSGLGFAQAEAASISISANRGGISVVVSDNKGAALGCNHGKKRVVHNINDRRHLDNCRMCRDARREADRREADRRREAERRAAALRKDNRNAFRR